MRAWGQYTIAILITLTTVPMYIYIYDRSKQERIGNFEQSDFAVHGYRPPPPFMTEAEMNRRGKMLYPEKYVLLSNQHCYGGAIVQKVGSTYTSVRSIDGRAAHCANGYSDEVLR